MEAIQKRMKMGRGEGVSWLSHLYQVTECSLFPLHVLHFKESLKFYTGNIADRIVVRDLKFLSKLIIYEVEEMILEKNNSKKILTYV